MSDDRNFDDISDRFAQNIYGTTKGKVRQHIIWQDIETLLNRFPQGQKLTILDAGGGQGQIAIKLAKLGHQVTICDISEQMLAIAKAEADLHQLQLHYFHCSVQQLKHQQLPQFDIVICHAVLEWIAMPEAFLSDLQNQLKPGGLLSLMFYNYHGLLFKTVTLGNFGYAQSGLNKRKKKTLSPDYPRKLDEVEGWLSQLQFSIIQKTGIRVFHDYIIDKDKRKSHFEALLALELQFCHQMPYIHFARYIHLVARRSNELLSSDKSSLENQSINRYDSV